jgi:transposase
VLAALRLDADRLPVPRADGDREALRILLVARQEITVACTAQTSRLRALLLAGDDAGRGAARTTLSGKALAALAGREVPAQASREQAVRQAETGRLALALAQARSQLKDNPLPSRNAEITCSTLLRICCSSPARSSAIAAAWAASASPS